MLSSCVKSAFFIEIFEKYTHIYICYEFSAIQLHLTENDFLIRSVLVTYRLFSFSFCCYPMCI